MKTLPVLLLFVTRLAAHDLATTDREALRAHILDEWKREHVEVAATASTLQLAAAAVANAANAPQTAKAFLPFTKLDLRADGEFLYVGSNGLPDHNMMVGITAWQQQVPLPQKYFDDNAWRIPLKPVPAKEPAMIQGRFLRGAIALAVNGIPIFNPQNNRGEISDEIGELDEWGGHCGRADDYHYHIAPLHLQTQVGKGMPVAYALDGYPVYGLTEPDGSPVANLDECHGHEDAKIGYHYHASNKYPYVIGGFHGEVVEAGEQVDPQPRAQGVREALTALRGAKITAFESTGKDSYKLSYEVNGEQRSIAYSINEYGTYPFKFDNGREGKTQEVYTARQGGAGADRPPGGNREGMKGKGKGKGQGQGGREGEMRPGEQGGPLPRPQAVSEDILDVNGDGVVTAQEFADNAKSNAAKNGTAIRDAMAKAKEQFNAFDHNRDGKLDRAELEELAGKAPAETIPQPRGEEMKRGEGSGRGGKQEAFVALPDQPRSSDGKFMLMSSVVEDLQAMPTEFTGDGDGLSPPLEWSGAPAATKSYALIMDHVTPDGDKKWYWTVYDIPASAASLPKDSQSIGKIGTGFKGEIGYEPPNSKGPGAKTYVITMYALSEPLKLAGTPGREELMEEMKGKVLASSSLRVVHSSGGSVRSMRPGRPKTSSAAPSTATPPIPKSSKTHSPPTGGPSTSTTALGRTPKNTASKKSIPNSPTSTTTSKAPSSSGPTTLPSTRPSSSAPKSRSLAGRQDGTRSRIST